MVVGNASRAVTDIGGYRRHVDGGRVRGESSNKRCAGMVGELSSTGRVISTSAEPLPAAEDDQEAGLSLLSTSSRISSKGTSIVGRGTLKRVARSSGLHVAIRAKGGREVVRGLGEEEGVGSKVCAKVAGEAKSESVIGAIVRIAVVSVIDVARRGVIRVVGRVIKSARGVGRVCVRTR